MQQIFARTRGYSYILHRAKTNNLLYNCNLRSLRYWRLD